MNSFTSPNEAFLLSVPASTKDKSTLKQISNLSTPLTEHLAMDSGEEFWFSGADPDKQVHGFLMRPHGYEEGKKYGMVFLVHGEFAVRIYIWQPILTLPLPLLQGGHKEPGLIHGEYMLAICSDGVGTVIFKNTSP